MKEAAIITVREKLYEIVTDRIKKQITNPRLKPETNKQLENFIIEQLNKYLIVLEYALFTQPLNQDNLLNLLFNFIQTFVTESTFKILDKKSPLTEKFVKNFLEELFSLDLRSINNHLEVSSIFELIDLSSDIQELQRDAGITNILYPLQATILEDIIRLKYFKKNSVPPNNKKIEKDVRDLVITASNLLVLINTLIIKKRNSSV